MSHKRILEVGSYDVNGSVRGIIATRSPSEYIGVDISPGPGVDVICDVSGLADRFGESSFDVVITTEMLEHVRDWRGAVTNLKRVMRPGAELLLTTRSRGFQFHGYPADYWRFDLGDMSTIFSDLSILELESDRPESPGVMVRAKRGTEFSLADLDKYAVYSVIRRKKVLHATARDVFISRCIASARDTARHRLPPSVVGAVRSRRRERFAFRSAD
ncbi:methyltransferase domain-containing protein [Pseudofrankia sp. DC12]|uniref:class I SAM-dependent methyltransferase n=1 Tax=Pseudofrankia sp. DC12 TaxID=683315 RepID=UPI0018DD28DE|nr:methyltransferase domain-containing protein [Pseudofrankia sp. DC12]